MLICKLVMASAAVAVMAANAIAQQGSGEPSQADASQSSSTFPQGEAEEPLAKKTSAGPHGGMLHQVGTMQVETVVELGGIRLFAYDPQGQSLNVRKGRGLATLRIAGDAKRYRYDLFPEIGQDKTAESLAVAVDLSRIAGQKVDLTFHLMGFQEGEPRPEQFAASISVPMTAAQKVAAAIEAQGGVCPVSGQKIGSMGKPIPVTVGHQTVYVCCAGCVDAVKNHPEKYLTAKPTRTVTAATDADAAAIARQKLCPVMDEPLDAMGGPYKTVVDGRVVYLCCPGCAKKLHADPAAYLAKLAEQGVAPPAVK